VTVGGTIPPNLDQEGYKLLPEKTLRKNFLVGKRKTCSKGRLEILKKKNTTKNVNHRRRSHVGTEKEWSFHFKIKTKKRGGLNQVGEGKPAKDSSVQKS